MSTIDRAKKKHLRREKIARLSTSIVFRSIHSLDIDTYIYIFLRVCMCLFPPPISTLPSYRLHPSLSRTTIRSERSVLRSRVIIMKIGKNWRTRSISWPRITRLLRGWKTREETGGNLPLGISDQIRGEEGGEMEIGLGFFEGRETERGKRFRGG